MSRNYFSFVPNVATKKPAPSPWDGFDGIICGLLPEDLKSDAAFEKALTVYPASVRAAVAVYRRKLKFPAKPDGLMHFDVENKWKVAVFTPPKKNETFFHLETARKTLAPLLEAKVKQIAMPLTVNSERNAQLVDTFVSALAAIDYRGPKYKKTEPVPKRRPHVTFIGAADKRLSDIGESAERLTWGTNLVRRLATMAGNDLTTSRYVALAREIAEEHRCEVEFYPMDRLADMKAGAFLAVAQGTEDRGGGILRVSYLPVKPSAKIKLGLVGKGITFDTGGNNLKAGSYMFGMHGDMTGSAVALALVLIAAKAKWPFRVDAHLAITDNILGPKSYRPNDVVTSLRGKTIEVVDTDAEGRMVLADTLWLASLQKPDLLVDFATLTGACIRAIGRNYSGAYTNRRHLQRAIIKAGRQSGERVWPFPNDADYGRALKSEVADIKQCRLTGGSDHIEAGYFLSRFVDVKTPWVHVDLSAAECEDELAHVPTKTTGFGIRFAAQLVANFFKMTL